MKCKYEGSGVWAGRCVGTKEVDPCPGYDKCERFKPDYKTNADHIRSMKDEELALEIMCPYHIESDMCNSVKTCNECCLDWLKQPYKEER